MTLQLLTDWEFWTLTLAIVSLIWSACNFILGKLVADKIQNNEIKHLTADIKKLQDTSKETNEKVYEELKGISVKLEDIAINQVKHKAICDTIQEQKKQNLKG